MLIRPIRLMRCLPLFDSEVWFKYRKLIAVCDLFVCGSRYWDSAVGLGSGTRYWDNENVEAKSGPPKRLGQAVSGAFAEILEIGGILRDRIRVFESKHRSPA